MSDSRKSILLIDDEPELRDLALLGLDSFHYRVVVAEGVPAAVTLMQQQAFDLMVCARLGTLSAFRAATRNAEVAILVLSSGRRWTMTETVAFAVCPNDAVALRELVSGYVASNVSGPRKSRLPTSTPLLRKMA